MVLGSRGGKGRALSVGLLGRSYSSTVVQIRDGDLNRGGYGEGKQHRALRAMWGLESPGSVVDWLWN